VDGEVTGEGSAANFVVPAPVKAGDTVAVVSPSWGAVGHWPHRTERGRAYLESLGLKVKLMPNAARNDGWTSASPEERASDLHEAFSDDSVAVVLAGIGGNHSNQLLPLLDFALIASHPKIWQGYSDMTVLHWAFLKHSNLATFYGPALTIGLAEFPEVLPHTDRWLRAAWFHSEPLRFDPADEWTEEILDFDKQLDLRRSRALSHSSGWRVLREGEARGPIIGGCLETICWHLKGSDTWIDPEGCIFFLEMSEEAPSPAHVDAYLTDLEQLGVFDACTGLLFARPMGYSDEDTETLWRVVADRTASAGIPVLANIECGHTDPMITLPLGVPAHLSADESNPTLEVSL
jgi:muramoyltetrapeptide carboxypeptidase LdcA involved in peptidoglycan recycling